MLDLFELDLALSLFRLIYPNVSFPLICLHRDGVTCLKSSDPCTRDPWGPTAYYLFVCRVVSIYACAHMERVNQLLS